MQSYTTSAEHALALGVHFSSAADDGYIGTEHLLLGLLHAKTDSDAPCIACKLLSSHGITASAVSATMNITTSDPFNTKDRGGMTARITEAYPAFTPVLCRILTRAEEEAERFLLAADDKGAIVGTEHLLFSLLCETDAAAHHILARHNLLMHELYGDVLSFLSAVAAEEAIFSGYREDQSDADVKHAGSAASPKSEQHPVGDIPYLFDMTAAAASCKYDMVVGREEEEESVLRILLHRRKNNPCLLGEAGVGKTAIVEGLSARIARSAVPSDLSAARILSMDLGGMLAGAKYRGEFEDRLRNVLNYCRNRSPNVILFIDEVHMLMGAGAAEGTVDAANLLKPALSRGEIRVIGATTRTEYDKTIGRDGAMSRRFQPVIVEEPDEARTLRMIRTLVPRLEKHHGVRISEEAMQCSISASVRCLPEYYLPDKAIDLLDDACAAVRTASPVPTANLRSGQKLRDSALLAGDLSAAQQAVHDEHAQIPNTAFPSLPIVTADHIFRAAEQRTGIRLTSDSKDSARYILLEANLNKTVLGQENAISEISEVLRRRHIGMITDCRLPISFLFYGPSGVGKTMTCEALAAQLFDSPHAFIRFDMSEYREAHTVSRLIGAPPGYIGHDDGGILTTAIRHRPYSLILFDAFEKAHPDVRHLMIQMLDSGILTDSRGHSVSFRHTVVVLSADIDPTLHTHTLGFSRPSVDNTEHEILSDLFSAELLSHIDAPICFRPLSDKTLAQILLAQLGELSATMEKRGITFDFDDTLIPYLLHQHAKEQGARGLRRAAAQLTETPIANALLEKSISAGDRIRISVQNDQIILEKDSDTKIRGF